MSKLGKNARPLLFIVSAPAGTGKSTLVDRLQEEFRGQIIETCSWTTRTARVGEKEGVHYHFVSKEAFLKKAEEGAFLEYVTVHGNYYGTLKEDVDAIMNKGKHAILVIDTQGAVRVQGKEYASISIFLAPPSLDELKRRLIARGTESELQINSRLAHSEEELKAVGVYHYHIVNDDLETAYQALKSICIAETHKVKHIF